MATVQMALRTDGESQKLQQSAGPFPNEISPDLGIGRLASTRSSQACGLPSVARLH